MSDFKMKPGDVLVRDPFEKPVEIKSDKLIDFLRQRAAELLPEDTPPADIFVLVNRADRPPNVMGAIADERCSACDKPVWRAPSLRRAMKTQTAILLCMECLVAK